MTNKILNMIKQGWYSLVSKDEDPYPQGQATVNGRPTKFIRLSSYGLFSNPPKDSHILLFSSQGQESTKFGIQNDFLRRIKEVKEGECGLLNTLTGAIVYLREDNSILAKNQDSDGETLSSIELKPDGTVQIDSVKDLNINTDGKVNIITKDDYIITVESGKKIAFGNGTDEVLNLQNDNLTEVIKGLKFIRDTITFSNGGGPTGPPANGALLSPIITNLETTQTALGNIKT